MPHVKTTVYLDDGDYRRLKHLAAAEGRSTAELIRLAVSEYTNKKPARPLPKSLGAFASGDGTLSERFEEILREEWTEDD